MDTGKRKKGFVNILNELYVSDHEGFRRFMRMDQKQFNKLADLISVEIKKQYTKMRKPISPKERLALTLRYLATGETFRSLEYQFRISRKAICYIVLEVCDAIIRLWVKIIFVHLLLAWNGWKLRAILLLPGTFPIVWGQSTESISRFSHVA